MPHFFDAHCHLDFCSDCNEIAQQVEGSIQAIDATVFPSSYVSAKGQLGGIASMEVALGLHPWEVAAGRVGENDLRSFERLARDARIIGEVGLDYHKRRRESRTRQLEALTRVLQAVSDAGDGKVVFLHIMRSMDDAFMLLERFGTCDRNVCVLHWFQGSEAELERASEMGCMFSVGERMLRSAKGRVLAAAIPRKQLLTETDSPAHPGTPWSAEAWLQTMESTVEQLAELRGMERDEVEALTLANGRRLLEA